MDGQEVVPGATNTTLFFPGTGEFWQNVYMSGFLSLLLVPSVLLLSVTEERQPAGKSGLATAHSWREEASFTSDFKRHSFGRWGIYTEWAFPSLLEKSVVFLSLS